MECLTVKETAKFLKISSDKAYELVNRGDFPSFKIGRSIRVSKDALSEWVASQVGGNSNERVPV